MSTSGDAERLSSSAAAGKEPAVSLRAVIDAKRRLDELGTARLVGEAAEVVHKSQAHGQALGRLTPEAITIRGGKITLDLPAAAVVAYSAPERLRGNSGDRRSDVFSLGVILWEALAHVRLFEGNDEVIRAAVLAGDVAPTVSELNANVPAELDSICKKALARDPADRYQSAKVMAAEIAAVLDDAGYPESNDDIVKWMATEFAEARPKSGTLPPPYRGVSTVMGMAPMRPAEEPKPIPKLVEPAPILPAAPILPRPSLADKLAAAGKPAVDESAERRTRSSADGDAKVIDRTIPLTKIDLEVVPPPLPTTTLTGLSAAQLLPAQPILLTQPKSPDPAQSDPILLTQPKPSEAKPPEQPTPATTIPGPATMAAPPGMKLPSAPPGATVVATSPAKITQPPPIANLTPAIGARTSILGSPNAEPTPAPVPQGKYDGTRTAILGSNAIIEATNAAVSAANPPAAPVLPSVAKPSISNAVTVATPSVVNAIPAAVVVSPSMAVEAAVTNPRTPAQHAHSVSAIEVGSAAANLPPASDDDFTSSPSHKPAEGRAGSNAEGGRTDKTGKGDVLAGWGWGTDSHAALDDEEVYEDDGKRGKKRLYIAMGAAGVAVLLIVVIALALGGGKSKDQEAAAKATEQEQAAAVPPPEPPKPEPVKTEPAPPVPGSAAAVEPPAPPPEPVKPEPVPEPVKAEPPVAEPIKAEPPKQEPPVVKPKKEPAAVAKKEPPKKEPPKKEPTRVAKIDVKKEPPPKPEPRQPEPLKLDAAAAYKSGLQQFARGDSTGALTTFKASLATDPGFAPTWRGIGLVYEKLGKKSQATTAFKRYLQLSPNAGDAEQIKGRLERLGS